MRFFRRKRQRIPVLCYHGMNANTTSYLGNDHIALDSDLQTLSELGYRLISGKQVVNFILGKIQFKADDRVICISFDDAPILDYADYDSPKIGPVESFRTILKTSNIFQHSQTPILNFAIADPTARNEIDIGCILGQGDMSSDWWEAAIDEGLYDMANHSWDHLHKVLSAVAHSRNEKGSFFAVDNYLDADKQIRQAYAQLQKIVNYKATPLFAYPYGHVNDYLRDDYFPNYQREHQQLGAFTTAGDYVTRETNRWAIPRFVCGLHWRSADEFAKIVGEC